MTKMVWYQNGQRMELKYEFVTFGCSTGHYSNGHYSNEDEEKEGEK